VTLSAIHKVSRLRLRNYDPWAQLKTGKLQTLTAIVPQKAVQARSVVRRRDSHMFSTTCSQMAVRLPALSTGRLPTHRNILGTHFCSRLSLPHGYGIISIEKSNDLVRNLTCDLPACSIVSIYYATPCPLPKTTPYLIQSFIRTLVLGQEAFLST
jgi:hypothetical protein